MRKTAFVLAALLLLSGLSACGQETVPTSSSSTPSSEPLKLEILRLELTRKEDFSVSALMYAVQALPDALKSALADQGVEVEKVEVTVGASPAATAQALDEGGIDLAVLPGKSFAELGGDAVPLLTTYARTALPDSGNAADWLGVETSWSDKAAGGQRMLILAGPSDYGRQLAARAASGAPLTWDELDRAAWLVEPDEKDMVSVWLADNYEGNTLSDLSNLSYSSFTNDSGYSLLPSLADGSADVAVIQADKRIDYGDAWQTELNRPAGIFEETTVFGVTEKYYETILAARPGDEILDGERFRSALAEALNEVSCVQGDITAALGGVFSVPLDDDDLDGMRRLATLGE
ncbi:MAG: PhnD/SsuA/transferrin family substrate-binding protein [Oscillibacter sp.]|nr:PhnD/SsuA/transferrin family substrate-binding protein [Oscillibacter sp.]